MIDLTPYANPALQFSGGKDSTACLYLLGEQLERVTVYWLNTGDVCPETLAVVNKVRASVPKFVEVKSDVAAWREAHGTPSDLVPASTHQIAQWYGMSALRLSSRMDCCANNLMMPLHNRMMADGVDAVIRGTKLADTGKLPAEGKTDCYDIILPLRDWSHDQVFAYLREVGAPISSVYAYYKGISAPECLGCTAWWDDGKAKYLKAKHPEQHAKYVGSLKAIRQLALASLAELDAELIGE